MNDELIRQIEFLRDIGVETLDVGAHRTAKPDVVPENSVKQTRKATRPGRIPDVPLPPVSPAGDPPPASLHVIREEIGDCQRCKLAPTRTNIVFGSGNPQAELVFVGEAPGFDEDRQGLPFVGKAGQLLTKIIESIDIKREDVYICNVLKCRPPDNRNPEPDEVIQCSPFMRKQLQVIQPKIVCCLGTFAAQTVLRTNTPISKLRGDFHDVDGLKVIATFHPAYLLRNPEKKRDVWEDMKRIRAELARLRAD